MPENISRDDFAAQINTKFRVFREPAWTECELIEVKAGKTNPHTESFSLLFSMPEDFPIEQGDFSFEHERLGLTEIFVVPVRKGPGSIIFEAVFNQVGSQS